MERKKHVEKVVWFEQTGTNTKKFREDQPVSAELRELMVNKVFNEFAAFATALGCEEFMPMLEEFAQEHNVHPDKQNELIRNLFWWRIFCDSKVNPSCSIIEEFIATYRQLLAKRPVLKSWLRELENLIPKFYFIGRPTSERTFVAVDILCEEGLDVILCDPTVKPITSQIAFGILLPLGEGLYFPVANFYHFDSAAREDIARHLHYYYDLNAESLPHEAPIHVLSAMLQIEQLVLTEASGTTVLQ